MFTFRKPLLVVGAGLLLSLSFLAGCGSAKPASEGTSAVPAKASEGSAATSAGTAASEEKTIKHVWGTTQLKKVPQKIVALDFSYIDMLTALEINPVASVGIGESSFPEYLKDRFNAKNVVNVGQAKQPNLEVLKSVKPDLIIASPNRHEMIKTQLAEIAPTIALDDGSYQAVLSNFSNLADVLDKKEQADKVKKSIADKISSAQEKVKNKPSVLVVGAFEDDSTVWLKSSFIGSLMTEMGTQYLFEGKKDLSAAESKTDIAKLSLERLGEFNPDYVFMYGDPGKWLNNPLYKNLKAVKENKAVEVNRDLWSKGRGPLAADLIVDQAVKFMTGVK
ncbi:ABC transporter substrate-binding protein [Paenibacillus radicis (ex Xue et al. 2023)]|uniref:Iron-siderophore ABC transporter substrate-binding protein n=1 Tax=Paenibacillus radicis (ex Xue et al. 2023) TaxID=2972489 RepID=A0ABT1YSY5_9BACL|nr:iron-siderophore ABC transporter substrate-binding protein [Paenibacillus radicis (ex Xue et al. 2023)]MCR8635810.1 iron-siderophore ABC transporter substrate-binding protein [Paenibacillus radicis (ex Xue et al. 2023)]